MAKEKDEAMQAMTMEPESAPVAAPEEVVLPKPEDDGLIKVAKDGETLAVNPACLAAHVALGWKEVQE